MEREAESDMDLEDDDDSVTVTIDNTNAAEDGSSTSAQSVPPPYDLVSQRIPYVWASSSTEDRNTNRERERLRLILEEQERHAQTQYEERREEVRRRAAVNEERDRVFRKARYETGFHVDTWPPKSVAARLFVRTIPDITDEDRIFITAEQVNKFMKRRKHIPEETDDSVVIVAESDETIRRIVRLMEVRSRKVVTVTDFDLRMRCQAWIEEQLRKFESGEFGVFICTIELEDYDLIPYAKFNIFNKLVEQHKFSSFVTRQSKRSRLRKQTSIVDVTLSHRDNSRVIANVVELMYMREEYPPESQMQFFENSCWQYQPSERRVHDEWQAREAICIEKETKELLEKIGPFVEKWWENPEILEKVQEHVVATKEIVCHIREPTKRLTRACMENCIYYQKWRQENRRRTHSRTRPRPAPVVAIRTPPLEAYLSTSTPSSTAQAFRPLQDEPSFVNSTTRTRRRLQ